MPAEHRTSREDALSSALRLVLDQVDYTNGACRPTEMVGAVLDAAVILRVRTLLSESPAD